MAQLNPNFEIDFSDINSYEQIQLINDTQLAKENLLMHRAYKEPSDDEIIRNHFSSFTFVDFCPKVFSTQQSAEGQTSVSSANNSTTCGPEPTSKSSLKYYELETFSDLFERINSWLKLNKDWRVVSMETLIYDCTSQFNHLKSSIYSNYLPRNTRGLRLFLSPSKSRFSGPQKIGCINVVPRKISGNHLSSSSDEEVKYETLDQILYRLNELLLTRPIEGRILSVETITLPMVNGYVNTESNYFMDSRLNILSQTTYGFAPAADNFRAGQSSVANNSEPAPSDANNISLLQGHKLIDILRVYYEFGPMMCGLVNLLDFIPRFYAPTPTELGSPQQEQGEQMAAAEKVAATESLTRLIRRSLAWFESERKRILRETSSSEQQEVEQENVEENESSVNLKACNLQVCQKTMLKGQLIQVKPSNAHQLIDTRQMAHKRVTSDASNVGACAQCSSQANVANLQDWCPHLLELGEPFQLKFVRLAYIVPVYNKYARSSAWPLYRMRAKQQAAGKADSTSSAASSASSSSAEAAARSPPAPAPAAEDLSATSDSEQEEEEDSTCELNDAKEMLKAECEEEELTKQAALKIVQGTNERQRKEEEAHQLNEHGDEHKLNDSLIGQLTYRLFAPCQLVNSSSCFSINPVNSSSPLARRGSVDLNGSGISSENAHPATSLLASPAQAANETQHLVTSFGAFFPAHSHDLAASCVSYAGLDTCKSRGSISTPQSRFTTNEFESVEAIKRRMEIYVTTNSMKVIAGETLVVNLSDALSCLSTAIEQTIVRSSFAPRAPSTWVSVYVLYAAVDKPQLPGQLLAQQKLRELSLINEEEDSASSAPLESIFRDDFEGEEKQQSEPKRDSNSSEQQSIRIEQNPTDSSLTLYNSAYDRTVALPSQPDNHTNSLSEPIDFGCQMDSLWLNESDLIEAQLKKHYERRKTSSKRKAKSKRNQSEDSQCSIM